MNKLLIYSPLILTFLTVFISNAQNKKAVLFFKDGTVKEGLGKIHNKSFVKFQLDKRSTPVLYHFAGLDSLKIYEEPEAVTYVYMKLSNKKEPKVLKQLQTGKVSLYYLIRGQNSSTRIGGNGPGEGGFQNVSSSAKKDIYVKKNDEDTATYLSSLKLISKNFKETTTEYFKDCPNLVEKISNHEFTKYDMRRIVDYYNSTCD
ncbi:hypothetical protein [Maribacter halichondriae]|uniref:hypothetical protein n=1 Tax=Maribacter halichondriae TaxID=2980554 RepID=UPI0023581C76|nr:hypothetical protein [Maribacter sp. Hal144]